MWKRAAAATSIAILLALAPTTRPAAQPATIDACEKLAPLDPNGVRRTLELFAGPILGKPADRWTAADFDAVRAAADACNGYVNASRQEVRAGTWNVHMNAAQRVVVPVSDELARIDAEAGPLRSAASWLPSCFALIEWKRDRSTWKTNADVIFGRDFLDMPREDLELARSFVRLCPGLLDMVGRARRVKGQLGVLIVDDIVYAIGKAEDAADEIPRGRQVKMLEVSSGGRRIPMAYLSPHSRMMVGIVNRSLHLERSLSIDELNEVTRWAEKVMADADSEVEMSYARAVKEYVNRQVFGD